MTTVDDTTESLGDLPVCRLPVRVCFMIDRLAVGGTEKQLLMLMRHLDNSRIEPSLCLLDGEDPISRSLEPPDCPVLRLGVRSLLRPKTCHKILQLAAFFRKQEIDVLQVQFSDSTYLGIAAAILARVPCIVRTRRDLGLWRTWKLRLFGRHLDGLLNRFCADAMVVNSAACRQAVLEQESPSPKWIEILHNGIDLGRYGSISQPTQSNVRIVGMVSALRPEKNHEMLIHAARIVCQEVDDVVFKIAGEGSMRTPLGRLIDEFGLADKVLLLGNVVDVPSFLAGIDVAVLCSTSEGSPNAVIEYMAAGKPIVATRVGGVTELLEHERQGLLVPSNDSNQLAQAILSLLRDSNSAARLGASAQREVQCYSIDAMVQRYEQFYLNLVCRSTAYRRRQGQRPAETIGAYEERDLHVGID